MPENYTYHIACNGLATSGAVSSAISSATVGICKAKMLSKGWTRVATVAAGGLSGGVTSSMAGGDFWDGVCNGLISSGLNHALHLVAEGCSPDDPPGSKKTQAEQRDYVRLEGKKYFWQLKHHYLEGEGKDVFLTEDQFRDIVSHGKIDYKNAELGEDGYYATEINLYDTNDDLRCSFGKATIKYRIDDAGKLHFSGFMDKYDFDSKPWGSRSASAEIITRTYNVITNGNGFNIYYNKHLFVK